MSDSIQASLANLDNASRQELMQWLESENSKSKFQMSIHKFNDMCFKRCVVNVDNGLVSSTEDQCLRGCLTRFLDTNTKVVKQ